MPFLLSPLHPRITSRISAPMPRVAMVTTETTEVTTKKSGRAQTVANQAGQVAVKGPEEPVDLGFESPLTDLESEGDAEPPPPKKRRRKAKVAEPVVYDIPPVETKSCTFKGRLGYACLNTVLRTAKPDPIFCSRTCRIGSIEKNGLDFVKNLGVQNARDLCKLIQWNEDNNIRFMRISSELFPFASHAKYGYSLDYAADDLKAAGDLANGYGHRLTLHPGQFTQIGSPKVGVVEASVRELQYHCSILQLMGMGKDSVMIIHMGGVYGDKAATLERFKENYRTKLSDEIRERLVLENDEICYSADDLLPVCEELDIPLVFDHHHNWINPTVLPLGELITRINAIWERKGIKPKQHLSSPRPGAETMMEKRAHADRCYELPKELTDDMDLMIEAKDKEQAVLHLYRIYQLEEVTHENLRPEKSQEVQAAGGKRKSYGPDPDNGEAPGDEKPAVMKPRGKKLKKDVITNMGRGYVGVGEGVSAEVDTGSRGRKEGNIPTPGPDDGAEGLKGKEPDTAAGKRAGDEAEPQQVKKKRKRRIRMNF